MAIINERWFVTGESQDKVAYKNEAGLSFLVADRITNPDAAKLIAAAPDLLQTLRYLANWIDTPDGQSTAGIISVRRHIGNVIKKAESK